MFFSCNIPLSNSNYSNSFFSFNYNSSTYFYSSFSNFGSNLKLYLLPGKFYSDDKLLKGLIFEPKDPNVGCPKDCPSPDNGLVFKFIDLRFFLATRSFSCMYFFRYSTSVGCSKVFYWVILCL